VPEHPEDPARSALGPARQPGHVVPPEDPAALRVREASARDGVGGELHRGPHQRDLPAADILPAVPPLSALLPAQYGSVQGQVAGCPGECRQASLAANPDHVDQCPLPGGAVRAPPYHIRYHKDPLDFWWLRGAVPPLGFNFLFAFLFFTEFFFLELKTKDRWDH